MNEYISYNYVLLLYVMSLKLRYGKGGFFSLKQIILIARLNFIDPVTSFRIALKDVQRMAKRSVDPKTVGIYEGHCIEAYEKDNRTITENGPYKQQANKHT